ncbi:MAG TPA: site-specific integrase [Candidatus Saccharimonadales bacterium]|nr:site-specific integrase [Candidatus Saccharimonadales bacterium]
MKNTTGHLFKRGENFYVFWRFKGKAFKRALRDENGNPITNMREAEKAKDRLLAPFATGSEVDALQAIAGRLQGRKAELARLEDEKNPPLTIGQAWSEFLTSPNRPDSGKSTMRQYEFQWQAFSDWMKEKHPDVSNLRGVTKEIAEEYAATLNHGKLTPSTYNKHLNLLALVFRVVNRKAKLEQNPWESPKRGGYLQRKRVVANSRRELTIEELRNVCQTATGELRVLLALGIYTGLRLGDCATLRWAETDLHRALIRRIPNKTARRNPKPVIVPIHPILRDMLSETPPDRRVEYVLPDTAALYIRRIDMVTDIVQRHFKNCGIRVYKPSADKENARAVLEVGFHSLRHTFVSLCRDSNAPLAVVESIVGHSSPAMTRHYTHVGEVAAGRAVALLPAIIGDDKPVKPQPNLAEVIQKAKTLAKSMTAKNWKGKKASLLALFSAN